MQEMWQQYMQNLAAGDQTTLIASLVGVVVAFFIIKMITGLVKAVAIIAVLLLAGALFFPDAQVMEKVGKGAQVVIEKGQQVSQKLIEQKGPIVSQKMQEMAQKAKE